MTNAAIAKLKEMLRSVILSIDEGTGFSLNFDKNRTQLQQLGPFT